MEVTFQQSGLFHIFAIQFSQMSALIGSSWTSIYLSAFNWLNVTCNFFIISCIGHLENTGSLSYAGLPNVDVFDYTI